MKPGEEETAGSGTARAKETTQQPTAGRIVNYCFGVSGKAAETRAALITFAPPGAKAITLRVFSPTNTRDEVIEALYSETLKPGCWSWPERV